jgi:hypothetical protein
MVLNDAKTALGTGAFLPKCVRLETGVPAFVGAVIKMSKTERITISFFIFLVLIFKKTKKFILQLMIFSKR